MGSGMANEPHGSADAFDLRTIRQLVKLMNENDLGEIDLRNATQRIRLRRRGTEIVPVLSTATGQPPSPASLALAPGGPEALPKSPSVEPAARYVEIKSPMLGTFYRASSPEAEPFVDVGTEVE